MAALHSDTAAAVRAWRARMLFFRHFLSSPREVGSVAPSFKYLGETMLRMIEETLHLPPDEVLSIAVLGVGTGGVARAFKGHEVYGFDRSPLLLDIARQTLPEAELRSADVLSPDFDLSELPDERRIAVVSCIPVVNLTARQKAAFERQAERLLDDPRVACFLQYSYLPQRPLLLPSRPWRRRWVMRNLPPAAINLWLPGPRS